MNTKPAYQELESQIAELKKQNEILRLNSIFQNEEKGKRAEELIIANEELTFQEEEKGKRAAELNVANIELAFQEEEKGKRAAELNVANIELTFQEEEKGKRAAELIIADIELTFQEEEKGKRAAELIITKIKIAQQSNEISKLAEELTIANFALTIRAERKKAEKDLQESLKEVSDFKYAITESAIVSMTNHKGIITYVNDNFCKISKYSSEELIGQDHRIVNSAYHHKEFIRDLWVTIANGKVWKGELKNKAKDGTIYWVNTTIAPFVNEHGKPYQYLAIRVDITDRKAAELQLSETNKSLEELVYIASHDLQVPLVSMEGYATELLESYADKLDENGKYCLIRLQANARRMHALVLSLLDVSRLNTKKYPHEKINLNLLLEKVLLDIALTIEKHKATINIEKMPQLFADKVRIESVFRNLITNSIIYGAKNITLGYENNSFFVEDNGIGIPESQLERIFDAGERLKKNNAEGVGMGLTFCKKVIEQHKGKIWAQSEGENKGTTMFIQLTTNN